MVSALTTTTGTSTAFGCQLEPALMASLIVFDHHPTFFFDIGPCGCGHPPVLYSYDGVDIAVLTV